MSPALGQVVTVVSSVDLGKTKIFIIEMVHKSRRPNGATGDRGGVHLRYFRCRCLFCKVGLADCLVLKDRAEHCPSINDHSNRFIETKLFLRVKHGMAEAAQEIQRDAPQVMVSWSQ